MLWTLPEPADALRHWSELLRITGGSRDSGGGEGRLVLVEGVWGTVSPAGISAGELTALLEPIASHVRVEPLSDEPALWGRTVADERYAVIATV